jgi:hypothetical protein
MPEPIYSDSHPEYVEEGEPPVEETISPEGDTPLQDTPAAADVNAPAEALISQDYVQKALFFMVILGVVAFIVRRRRRTDSRYEKSVV